MSEGDSPVVVINLSADAAEFQNQLKQIESLSKNSGDKIAKGVSSGLTDSFSSIKSWALGIGGAVLAGITFKKIISEAMESDSIIQKFNNSLALSGRYSKKASDDFQNFASVMQDTSKYTDDAVIGVGSLLNSFVKMDGAQLKNATKAVVDFSAQTGKGLEESAMLMVRAVNGNGNALARYGINLDSSKSKTDTLKAATDALTAKFGGSAASQINTFEGALERTKNMFSEILENLGKTITRSPQIVAMIKLIGDGFKSMGDSISKMNMNDFIMQAIDVGRNIITYIIRPLELLKGIGKAVFSAIVLGFDTIIAGIGQVGGAFGFLLEKLGMGGELSEALKTFAESTGEVMMEQSEQTGKDMADALTTNMSDGLEAGLNKSVDAIKAAKPVIVKNVKDIKDDVTKLEVQYGSILASGMGKGVQSMVGMLAKAQFSMKNFSKAFLSIIADMATQTGMAMIAVGVGKLAITTGTGAEAIAAGAALVAIGEVIKSTMGGGTEAGAAGAGAGGGAGIAGMGGEVVTQNAERALPNTNVQVVVQGDILDSDQSASRIFSMLNNSFEKTGQTLVRGVMA